MKRRVKALTVVLAICLITVFIRCQSNETPFLWRISRRNCIARWRRRCLQSWTTDSFSRRGSSACLRMKRSRGRQRSCSIQRFPNCPRSRREKELSMTYWCQSNATATSTIWRSWVQMSTRSKKRWKAKKHWKNYKEPAFLWNNRVCGSGQL